MNRSVADARSRKVSEIQVNNINVVLLRFTRLSVAVSN